MDERPNFRPRVIEPMLADGTVGVDIELEFHEKIPGLSGDTVMLYLCKGTTIERAQAVVGQLHDLGVKVKGSNPH